MGGINHEKWFKQKVNIHNNARKQLKAKMENDFMKEIQLFKKIGTCTCITCYHYTQHRYYLCMEPAES